ncbi:hypothetical protein CKO37_06480 [Rubrivivax gelatinosus]|nr:hypothetical protein [Rubrivivax gelatinosus]
MPAQGLIHRHRTLPNVHRLKPLNDALIAGALALAAAQACAATPDAGQISREPRSPVPLASPSSPALKVDKPTTDSVPEGGPTVVVSAFELQGNTVFDTPTLQALLADELGRPLTFADLTRLAARLTRHYRDAGYLVARAYLPAQEVNDGVLRIAVLEGRLSQVELMNAAGLKPSALAALGQLPADQPLQARVLDQTLLTLADLPGSQVQSTLRPGQALGASELLVEVSRTRGVEGSADLDNFGSTYTGEYRAGSSLYWNNPLALGDQLSLRVQVSNDHLNYERLAYQLPLGVYATRLGVAVSNMSYRLGKDFSSLDADGRSQVSSAYLRQGLLRSIDANWYGQLQFDAKRLRDSVDSTDTTTHQRLRNWVLGLNGDWRDGLGAGGSNTLLLNLTVGKLSLDADSAALDAVSAQTAGDFNKFELALQRVQFLRPGWSLALNLRGQAADHNLPSVEKFALGGSQGVRAYPQGEALGDSGWLASAELRWNLAPGWQLQAFGDAGGVKLNRQPWLDEDNFRHLSGLGLGASWGTPRLAVSLSSAWATSSESSTSQPDRRPRLWAQASYAF